MDNDALSQLQEFKQKFNLDLNPDTLGKIYAQPPFTECMENQQLFDWLVKESSGLLLWLCLQESMRELKVAVIEDLIAQLRDLNRRKSYAREMIRQCKEAVEEKISENERVYEAIRLLETNIMDI